MKSWPKKFRYWEIILLLCPLSGVAQTIDVDGFVYDRQTKEALIGAAVFVSQNRGVVTNASGYFHFRYNPAEDSILYVRMLGYEDLSQPLHFTSQSVPLLLYLTEGVQQLDEVEINESVWQNDLLNPNIVEMSLEQVKNFPVLAGEADPIKYLQSLPGITPGREGRSDLHVRGGSPDQNLFLLDNMPMFTIQHMGGLLSVLDPTSLKGIKLYKGGFPARYGGRLSSVVDVQLKDGNKQQWNKYADIGIVATKLAIEGPLIKDTLSMFLSLRRANTDLYTGLLSLLSSDGEFRAGYTFYDLTGKLDYRPSERDQVSLTLYGGLDRVFSVGKTEDEINGQQLSTDVRSGIRWTNVMGVLNWNHASSKKHFRNVMVGFSRYGLNNGYTLERETAREQLVDFSRSEFSGHAWDIRLGLNYEYNIKQNIQLHYGLQGSFQRFLPGYFEEEQFGENVATIDQQYGAQQRDLLEFNGYLDAQFTWQQLRFQPGVRISYWANVYDQPHLEPRLSISYRKGIHSVEVSAAHMRQSMHLLSNNTAGVPLDLWVPAVPEAPPMQSTVYSVGYARNTSQRLFQFGGYYKTYENVIEFEEGKSFFGDELDWNDKIVSGGIGQSYGIEFLLRQKVGRLNGWVSYTYSRSLRRFETLNENQWFPYRYDRPHNGSVFLNYQWKEGVSLGVSWLYASGDAITLPISQYEIPTYDRREDFSLAYDQFPVQIYGERNGYRVPSTHRLDINIAFVKQRATFTRTFKVGVYNAYNRLNPYYVYLDNTDGRTRLYKAALLPFFPFVSWSFVF